MLRSTERCRTVWAVRSIRCVDYFHKSTEDDTDYAPTWITGILNFTGYTKSDVGEFVAAFDYKSESELNGDSYEGQLSTYSGGGYVANLGETFNSASAVIDDLEQYQWIDQYTRAVFVEFTTWNPCSTLTNLAMVLFEYPSLGGIFWSTRMEVIQLYRYVGPNGALALLVECLCAIMVAVVTILEVRKMCKQRQSYFKSIWHIVQVGSLMLFYVSVGLYAMRCLWTVTTIDEIMNNPGKDQSGRNFKSMYVLYN